MGHTTTGEAAATGHAADGRPRIPFAEIQSEFSDHYGYKASALGDDADTVLIVGHVEPLHAIGIARHLLRTTLNYDLTERFTVTEVAQRYAEFMIHCDACKQGLFCDNVDDGLWFVQFTDEPDEFPAPVTVVELAW